MADSSGELVRGLGVAAAKTAPPAVVSLYYLVSRGLPFVVTLMTLIYVAIQAAHLLWKWRGEIEDRAAARARQRAG